LCEHLDGVPLAIELAAARITVLTPAELLQGLSDRFTVLSVGRATAATPTRPRSNRGVEL